MSNATIERAGDDVAPTGGWYPWQVLAAVSLCVFMLMGVSIYSFIILVGSLSQELHWSAAQSGGLVSAMWCAAPLALFCTPLVKRFGPWRLIVAGLIVEAISLWALAYISQFWELYTLRIVMGVGKIIIIVSAPVVIAGYFRLGISTALSVFWAAATGSGFALAPLSEYLAQAMGWRQAAHVLGALVLLSLPIAWALFSYGRSAYLAHPARRRDAQDLNIDALTAVAGNAWGQLARAVGPGVLVLTALAIVASGAGAVAVMSHEMTYLGQLGFSDALGANALAALSGMAIFGSLAVGRLLDYRPPAWSAAMIGGGFLFGLVLLLSLRAAPSTAIVFIASGLLGFAAAGSEVLWMNLARLVAPPAIFATAYGGWYFSLQVGYAIGGPLGGMSLDRFGGMGLLLTLIALFVTATLVSLRLATRRA